METQKQLKRAAEALKDEKPTEARQILDDILRQEPNNVDAWLLLFTAIDDPLEKIDCLKRAVRLRPKDERTRQRLHKYQASSEYREAKSRVRAVTEEAEEKRTKTRKRKEVLDKLLFFLHTG